MDTYGNLKKAREVLASEPNLIELPDHGRVVLVGDTHGDRDATENVISKYLKNPYIIVFLGDYVDRGEFSKENIDFLLELKTKNPERLILLMGNHDSYGDVHPSYTQFWNSLNDNELKMYKETLMELPLVASGKGFLALHGAPPSKGGMEDINKIRKTKSNKFWKTIKWGDFIDFPGGYLGDLSGRPCFGQDYFEESMERYGKKVLVRSHQSNAREVMFNNRCITIFTSIYYGLERKIAIANLKKGVSSAKDFKIEDI